MLMRLLSVVLMLALTQLLAACGSFPKNPQLDSYQADQGYRFDGLDRGANTDELFVIVILSGGGTRAAALSFGIMEALRDTTIDVNGKPVSLLQEVDVISSISGGSFPAAYYALKPEQFFKEFPDKFLYRDIESDLAKAALSPSNWFKLGGSSFGRSDLAAEFYNEHVFAGATYADIISQKRRPFVILNATDMSSGQQFSFIQDQFDLLCSDLSGLPVARAAASSSAFPGLLTPLTYQNYAGSCDYTQPGWVAPALKNHKSRVNARRTARAQNRMSYTQSMPFRRDYVHIVDGGVADNLGLRQPLLALTSNDHSWSVVPKLNNKEIDKILVIVVNAATSHDPERDKSSSVPGIFDTINTAAGVPLDNYSFDSIDLLSAAVREYTVDAKLLSGCKKMAAAKGDECRLDIPEPHAVELFAAQVAFEYIESDEERHWFKNLPTTFALPRETIKKLRAIGPRLLSQDNQFKKFLGGVNGCLPTPEKPC